MFIDGIEFNQYDVKSVKLDLDTCICEFEVVFHKDKRRVVRRKIYRVETNCNVDINEVINNLESIINGEGILS